MRVQLTPATPRPRPRRDERGGVAVVVGLLLAPFMLLSAFVLDLGIAYAQAQAFGAGADSAALAVVNAKRELINANPGTPTNCESIVLGDTGQSQAIAEQQTDANAPYDLRASTGDIDVLAELTCVDNTGAWNPDGVLKATVTVERDVPTMLARVAGVDTVKASRNASAALGVAQDVNGVFPLGVCNKEADAIAAEAAAASTAGLPYPTHTIDVTKVWNADCSAGSAGSGNWGWLDCGEGLSAVAIGGYIANGCDTSLTLQGSPASVTVGGAPGNKINSANVSGPFDAALGNVYALPVYDKITGHGSTTDYRIVGFIQLKMIGYDTDGNVDVQYVSDSPVGDVDSLCGIGSITCTAYNAWSIGLTD